MGTKKHKLTSDQVEQAQLVLKITGRAIEQLLGEEDLIKKRFTNILGKIEQRKTAAMAEHQAELRKLAKRCLGVEPTEFCQLKLIPGEDKQPEALEITTPAFQPGSPPGPGRASG